MRLRSFPMKGSAMSDSIRGQVVNKLKILAGSRATRASEARRISGRRRRVDPTTCDRDYSVSEREFMDAMQAYKTRHCRPFPTWSEVLEVISSLGYAKR
jgi:hypothetical protein